MKSSVVGNFRHFVVTKHGFIRIYEYTTCSFILIFLRTDENNTMLCDDFLCSRNRGLIPTGEKFYDDQVKNYSPIRYQATEQRK